MRDLADIIALRWHLWRRDRIRAHRRRLARRDLHLARRAVRHATAARILTDPNRSTPA